MFILLRKTLADVHSAVKYTATDVIGTTRPSFYSIFFPNINIMKQKALYQRTI